jgi:hypothetical protein
MWESVTQYLEGGSAKILSLVHDEQIDGGSLWRPIGVPHVQTIEHDEVILARDFSFHTS